MALRSRRKRKEDEEEEEDGQGEEEGEETEPPKKKKRGRESAASHERQLETVDLQPPELLAGRNASGTPLFYFGVFTFLSLSAILPGAKLHDFWCRLMWPGCDVV